MLGTSFTPNSGSHVQKIPPTTSSNESIVNSPDNNCFEPMLNKIKPDATITPWQMLKNIFFNGMKKLWSWKISEFNSSGCVTFEVIGAI